MQKKTTVLSPWQSEIYASKAPFRVINSGRRIGKTYFGLYLACEAAYKNAGINIVYIAIDRGQLRRSVNDSMHSIIDPSWIESVNVTDHTWRFRTGSKIYFMSAETKQSLRGTSPSPKLIVVDEFSYIDRDIFMTVILPMSIEPDTKYLLISTPPDPKIRIKNNLLKTFYQYGQDKTGQWDEWESWRFKSYEVATEKQMVKINRDKKLMTKDDIEREYGANLEDYYNKRVFNEFKYETHVKELKPLQDNEQIYIGLDFNIDIMAASAFVLRKGKDNGAISDNLLEVHFIKDFNLGTDANVDIFIDTIKELYPNRSIIVFPDPAGNARNVASPIGVTAITKLKQAGFTVRHRKASPKQIDSAHCVNAMFKNAEGDIRMYVDSCCKYLIDSLNETQWKEQKDSDRVQIDKTLGNEHWTDGVRYAIEYLFPIKRKTRPLVHHGRTPY